MKIRCVDSSDYDHVISTLNDWWGGRMMSDMLPKLFFVHFKDTSFIAEEDGEIVGFLIGFLSQSRPAETYVHFVGVHPDHRKQGIGQALYERFFEAVKQKGRTIVRCVTSPVNKQSIAFHTRIGFQAEENTEGVKVHQVYDGPGNDRVLFVKQLHID
jgi:GNAT superfamily N-acetyltransferase